MHIMWVQLLEVLQRTEPLCFIKVIDLGQVGQVYLLMGPRVALDVSASNRRRGMFAGKSILRCRINVRVYDL